MSIALDPLHEDPEDVRVPCRTVLFVGNTIFDPTAGTTNTILGNRELFGNDQ